MNLKPEDQKLERSRPKSESGGRVTRQSLAKQPIATMQRSSVIGRGRMVEYLTVVKS